MARAGEIISSARDTLNDASAVKWSRERLLSHLNDGIKQIAVLTHCFVAEVGLPASSNGRYTLPANAIAPRWVQYGRDFIDPISFQELRKKYGNGFHRHTSTRPIHWYNDMGSNYEIRLYPIPSEISRSVQSFEGSEGAVVYNDVDDGDTVVTIGEDGAEITDPEDRAGVIFMVDDPDSENEYYSLDVPFRGQAGDSDDDQRHWIVSPVFLPAGSTTQAATAGGLTMAFVEAIRIGYSYFPDPCKTEKHEISLPDHLETLLHDYIVHRAYEKAMDTESIGLSDRFFQKFAAQVNSLQSSAAKRFTSATTRGKYRRI